MLTKVGSRRGRDQCEVSPVSAAQYLIVRLLMEHLRFQAATAHSFGLATDLALQSVTSVPARSMEIDHRVGFVRPGYDADIVLWDSHPLSVGATPLQVFIDGRATLDPEKVESSRSKVVVPNSEHSAALSVRANPSVEMRESLCTEIGQPGAKIKIQGITKSFLIGPSADASSSKRLTMVIEGGKIACFDTEDQCLSASANSTLIRLREAHVLPGLTAVSVALGLGEIATDDSTGDGTANTGSDLESIPYAKYGVHLDGKSFARARIGGVTKAITAPKTRGFPGGVSVAIKTSGKKNILNGGIFKDDVALHFKVGSAAKSKAPSMLPIDRANGIFRRQTAHSLFWDSKAATSSDRKQGEGQHIWQSCQWLFPSCGARRE